MMDLYSFVRVLIMKFHKPSGLINSKVSSHSSGGWRSEPKVLMVPSQGGVPGLSIVPGSLLVIIDVLWLWLYHCNLLPPCGILPVCVCPHAEFPFLYGHWSYWIWAYPVPVGLHLPENCNDPIFK